MKNKTIWLSLSFLLVAAMLLASCAKSTTTSTSISTSTFTKTTTSTITKTTTTTTPTTTATTTVTGNWWDKLGKPQYGGTMVLRINRDIVNFDPYYTSSLTSITCAWMERLHADDWTLDPAVFAYNINFRPYQYVKGQLAESWEFPKPNIYLVHLRKGIHWQNIDPVNGREFTADDIVWNFDRLYGLGDGFTKPSPYQAATTTWQDLQSVTADDKYTVIFQWKTPNPEFIMETQQAFGSEQNIAAHEAVEKWGNVADWHHAIGTGPFILTDFVPGSSATMVKNPNYWGYDERYPQNKLPYVNALKILIITDNSTALAAMRTGKIDVLDQISLADAQSMKKTNPEILQITIPLGQAITLDMRNDVASFNDIRVRKALQMAINLPEIATDYYGGYADPYPAALTSSFMTGWGFPYTQWPQDLKDEYAYNPTTAKALLAAAGYPTIHTDIVANTSGDMNLLQIIKSDFADIGVIMDIRTMEATTWTNYVVVGHKQDQMAQNGLVGHTGKTYEPLRQLNEFQASYLYNYDGVSDPVFEAFYPKALAANDAGEVQKILRDANEYVARQHFTISLLQPNLFAVYQPWFKGYNGQYQSISGGSSGPHFLYFYAARFWIDTNLKASMGH